VAIFDVTGHGIASSLLANRAHSEIHRLMIAHPESARAVVADANGFIYERFRRANLFMSLCVMIVDGRRRSLSWCGAGHPPALLKRADDGGIQELESGNLLVGIAEDCLMGEPEPDVALTPGDALILYTDGVTDHLSPSDSTREGIDHLIDVVRHADLAGKSEGLSEYIASQFETGPHIPAFDDMTLVVVKLRD
jgi:serine phosphatase RsbU (regulator of sigma subunit)